MQESIGNSMVFTFIIVFTSIFILLFVGSIAYSKGFKVRNRLIDIIEKHEGFTEQARLEIDENLGVIGYQIVEKECGDHNGVAPLNNSSSYRYCVYKHDTSKGPYYGVKVFIHFDLPLVGEFIEIPLYGETRVLFDKSEVEG